MLGIAALHPGGGVCQVPAVRLYGEIYHFKQHLCYMLLKKHRTKKQCAHLVRRFLQPLEQLNEVGLTQLVQLGQTLTSWATEIATCGASPGTMASPKAFTPRWRCCSAKRTAFETSKTTDYGLGLCVR